MSSKFSGKQNNKGVFELKQVSAKKAPAKKKVGKEQYVIGYDDNYVELMSSEFYSSEREALEVAEEMSSDEDTVVLLKVIKRFKVKRVSELKEIN